MSKTNTLTVDQSQLSQSCRAASFLLDAELELKSFARAVSRLHGPEEALQAINEWIDECERLPWPDDSTAPDWRQATIAAAVRLSKRVR
jgi:hypothetical protein